MLFPPINRSRERFFFFFFTVIEMRLTTRQLAHPPRKYKFPDWLSPFSIPRIIDLDWTTGLIRKSTALLAERKLLAN